LESVLAANETLSNEADARLSRFSQCKRYVAKDVSWTRAKSGGGRRHHRHHRGNDGRRGH
jgi:hypothetical protein